MNIDLKNRVVLVTGASRGIGAAVAEALGAGGATVAIHFNRNQRSAEKLAEKVGNRSAVFQADLSVEGQPEALFQRVVEHYSSLDVLVNNAGIAIHSPPDEPDDRWQAAWEATLRVNLTAAAILCRMAVRLFRQRKEGGRIVNIASRAAFRGDTVDYLAYAASKGGMVALTRSIARGYGRDGITAFSLAPGFVRTDMAESFFQRYGEEPVLHEIALNRLTEPRDVAPLVVFLASGSADHATGSTFDINAGSYVR